MSIRGDPSGLRLLSLDGGGIRGMSTLLILKQVMHRIQQREHLLEIPLPCEYFDLIGGSSTGGIIAILLGRLRMSIDDAIDYYGILSKTIFSGRKPFGTAKFNHKNLEKTIKAAVKQHIGDESAKMLDNRDRACKTFVCTRMALNLNSGHPQLFRSYTNPEEATSNCEIWKAACATFAVPGLFDQVKIGENGYPKQFYIGGDLGINNPIRQVLEECRLVFPKGSVACIISIGSGWKSTIQVPNPKFYERIVGKYPAGDAAKEIAFDSEATEELISRQFRNAGGLYYRFNVGQGMQSIELADVNKTMNVAAHTTSYLSNENVSAKLQDAVLALCERKPIIPTSQITGSVTLPESVVPSKLFYNIPHTLRARHFVARHSVQKKLDELFNKQRNLEDSAIVSLIGMGGAGKTQLALEYCRRKRGTEGLEKIFWINAASQQTVNSDMKNIAKLLAPFSELENASAAIELVKERLSSWHDPWLIVLDNLDDPSKFDNIPGFIPFSPSGSVLITSRHHHLKRLSPYYILLQEMDESESFHLLLGRQPSETELQHAKQILERLGWLPLAIDQAQAYISDQGLPLQMFITQFDQRKNDILQILLPSLSSYKREDLDTQVEKTLGVYTTWEMSLTLLKSSAGEKFPLLENVLVFLGFYHPRVIREKIFSNTITDTELATSPMMLFKTGDSWDSIKFGNILTSMQNLCLLRFSVHETEGINISIHSLVSEWLRMRTKAEESMHFIQPALRHLTGYLSRHGNLDRRARTEGLLHIDTLLSLRKRGFQYSPQQFCDMIWTFGNFYRDNGRYESAERVYKHGLTVFEKMPDPKNVWTYRTLENLGQLYMAWGRYKDAEEVFDRALAGWEMALGSTHSFTLSTVHHLGQLYQCQGQIEAAKKMYNRALAGFEGCGLEHQSTLAVINDLGLLCQKEKQFEDAEKMYNRVLKVMEKTPPLNPLDILATMNDLGSIYDCQGKLKDAMEMYDRVLAGYAMTLGPDHPNTLTVVNNIAQLYTRQGQFTDADKMYNRALKGKEKILGQNHLSTLLTMNNFGTFYAEQDQFRDAEEMFNRALAGYEKTLDPDHPETLSVVNNLGCLYERAGQLVDAKKMYNRVLASRTNVLGANHPDTLATLENLRCLGEGGEKSDALAGDEADYAPTGQKVLETDSPASAIYFSFRSFLVFFLPAVFLSIILYYYH